MLSTSDIKNYTGKVQLGKDVNGNPKGLIVTFPYNPQFVNAWKGYHYNNGFKPHWDGDKKYWKCDLDFIEIIKVNLPCFEFSDGVKQWLGLDLQPEMEEIQEPQSIDEEIAEMEERLANPQASASWVARRLSELLEIKNQQQQEINEGYLLSLLPEYRQETGRRVFSKAPKGMVETIKNLAKLNPTERDIAAPEQWLIKNYPPYQSTLNWDSRTAVIAVECAVALWKAHLRWEA